MALQAYDFNAKYGGKNSDPDITSALLDVAEDKDIVRSEIGHKDAVRAITVSSDGKTVFSADESANVLMFENLNFSKPIFLRSPLNLKNGIRALAYDSDSKLLYGANTSGSILIWDIKNTSALPASVKNDGGNIVSMIFDTKSKQLILADMRGNVKLGKKTGENFIFETIFATSNQQARLFLSENVLVAGFESGDIVRYDLSSKSKLSEFKVS